MKNYILFFVLINTVFSFSQNIKSKCLDGNCKNNKGTFLYADSSIYIGDFVDRLRSGFGKITYKNKSSYEGQWFNDKRNGDGIFIDSVGNKYEGTWVSDKENGKGTYTDLKNNIYEGVWENGELKGNVTIRYRNKNLYEGEYNNGLSGKGKFSYADGSIYIGEFVKNKRSGYGELSYSFGLTYKGNFVSNEISGQGDFYDNKTLGKIASGIWKTEKTKEGDLIFINSDNYLICNYVSKDLYYGQSYNRLPNSNGIMKYSNGDIYNGEWKDGVKEGFGKLVTAKSEDIGYWEKGNYIGKEMPVIKPQIILVPETCNGNSEPLGGYSFPEAIFSGSCKNGLKNGVWNVKSVGSGQTLKSITYNNGIKHGEYKEFYNDGSVSKKSNYKNGLLVGRVVNYAKDGRIKEINVFRNGIVDSTYYYNICSPFVNENTSEYYLSSVWSSDASLGNFKLTFNSDNVKGKYTNYFPSGKIEKIGFSSGHSDEYGKETTYDEKGNIISDIEYESLEEHCFFDPHGIRNGWKMVGNKKKVYKDGFHIETYENDKLIWKGFEAGNANYIVNGINSQLNYYREVSGESSESGLYKTVYFKNNKLDYEIEFIEREKTYQKKSIFDNSGRILKIEYDSMVYQIDYTENLFEKESFRQSLVRKIVIRENRNNFVMYFDDVYNNNNCMLLSFLAKGKFNITASGIINGQKYTFKKYILENSIIDSISKNGILITLNTTYLNGNSVEKSFYESGKIKSSIQYKRKFYYFDNQTLDDRQEALNGEIMFFNVKGDKILFGEIYEEFSLNSINYTGNLNYYDAKNVKTEIKLNGELPTNEVVNKILKEALINQY
jgi:antitoxin component YwqK of YwqJK toxin-antitoxin module